ncbi:MAG: hypothetical protein IPH96_04575 [Saprospiraceae bacterium]|nr:hypothetical protein [Saprospiraceae bacterium]
MKTNNFSHETMDDIVFEHRNKTYGAYSLRKMYNQNMSKGLFFSCTLFSLTFFIGLLSMKLFLKRFGNFTCKKIHEVYVNHTIPKYYPRFNLKTATRSEIFRESARRNKDC